MQYLPGYHKYKSYCKSCWSLGYGNPQKRLFLKEDEVRERIRVTDGAGMASSIHGLQLSENSIERHLAVQADEKCINTDGINLTRTSEKKGVPLQSFQWA